MLNLQLRGGVWAICAYTCISLFIPLGKVEAALEYEFAGKEECGRIRDSTWPIMPMKRRINGSDSENGTDCDEDVTNPRIVGGFQASRNSFPAHIGILEVLNYNGKNVVRHICGATAIGKNMVITASHCLKGRNFNELRFIATMSHGTIKEYQESNAKYSLPMPKIACARNLLRSRKWVYQSNDFVLVGLDRNFKENYYDPACISSNRQDYATHDLYLLGMGINGSGGSFNPEAHFLPMKGFDNDDCVPFQPKYRNNDIDRDFNCATPTTGGSGCSGDSGSGIYFRDQSTDRITVVGVSVSGTANCEMKYDRSNVVVFTSVSYYEDNAILYNLLGCANGVDHRQCLCFSDSFPDIFT